MTMERFSAEEFEELVALALQDLPAEFAARMENVDVVVAEEPTLEQLRKIGLGETDWLLGLYEGIPLTGRENYGFVLPDKITIFQRPIEACCRTADEIIREVRVTVAHEVAHHFGISDERLEALGLE